MIYTEAIIIVSSPACHEAFDLSLAGIPLHCFDIIEMHFSNRVIRQFGLVQHIQDYVDTRDELQDIIGPISKPRGGMNWFIKN